MSFANSIRKNWTKIVATALVVFGVLAPTVALASTSQPRDCETFSIMYCGAYSKTEWLNKVAHGDTKHSASNLQQIYYHEGRGITEANFRSTVEGVVTKDGRVIVGGKTVATGAHGISRDWKPGSVKSGSVWLRPDTSAFLSDIQAYVNMDGGTFHYYVLKSCGNAGVATPVAKPTPTPTATPKPTPTPTPVASFSCVSLTPTRPDVDKRPNLYRFTVQPKVSNTTVSGYRFSFSDNSAQATTSASTPYVEKEIKSGTLKVHAQVITPKGTTPLSEACSASVTVTQATPTPTPTGQVLGVTLPATGPEAALGGVAGLSAIGYAGRAYIRSRKSLLGTLRGKRN